MSICRITASLLAILLIASCSSSKPAEAPDPAEAESEVAEPSQAERRPDPGPRFPHETGRRKAELRKPYVVVTTEVFVDGEHTYLSATLPETFGEFDATTSAQLKQWGHVPGKRCDVNWLDMAGERHGRAVLACEPARVVVRLVGDEVPGESIQVDLFFQEMGGSMAEVVDVQQPVVIQPAETSTASPEIAQTFQESLSKHFERYRLSPGGDPTFFDFARHRLDALAQQNAAESGPMAIPQRTTRQHILRETMGTYTGLLSVEETLQIDRAFFSRAAPASARTVDLETIEGVGLAEHPWDAMIAELGQEPAIEPLAAFVPDDFAYVHFHDLRSFVRLARELDTWIAPIAQALENKAGSRHLMQRYETMLGIERSGLSEHFGHLATKGVAVATSDPFLREGGDVSLLFHVRDRDLLNQALDRYEAAIRENHPTLSESVIEVGDHSVRLLSTPDGAVRQHRVELGEVMVLSTSMAALQRFIDLHEGRTRPLSERGDFRYLRAMYPFDKEAEDGFVFIGDSFVHHTVSPRVRILMARRMQARADLAAVNNAALLFGWLEGRAPADAAELVASGLLRQTELSHADGQAIAYAPDTGASSAWGNLAMMTPLIELEIDRVTPDEQQAYEAFRQGYLTNWQTLIDPIAARLRFDEEAQRIEVDARMLPLVNNSEYERLADLVGQRAVSAPGLDGALQWTLAVGDDASLRRDLNRAARQMSGNKDLGLDWLGDWVMVGAYDRSGIWDLAEVRRLFVSGSTYQFDPGRFSNEEVMALAPTLPLYLGAHVANPAVLAGTLSALRGFVESTAPGLLRWEQAEPYRETPITTIRAAEGAGQIGLNDLQLHYTVAGGVFLMSLNMPTLEALIDAGLDGHFSTATPQADDALLMQTMITYDPAPGTSWLERTVLGMLETRAIQSYGAAQRSWMALSQGLGALPEGDAERRDLAMRYLGYEPQDLHGGDYSIDAHGRVTHTIYGEGHDHVIPPLPVTPSSVTQAVQALESLKMHLGFEGEGDHHGLHSVVSWERGE
ncbi:hypothetical protein FRC96_11540 [Lujinxingia vulgaris]|uniref:Uncharacterized protein n=1 Tax=Lujinxingia vulgaris TaxID=2600176 RepID=A0A5C6X0P1_9DELT|nr:hypothetical protein [Lujinxingia vulgaris]TXD35301.1 hypothetical protein FRC96_11540 [Lujinxingia vulgaris]